jgi:Protein of unknown function (DUF1565)
MARFAPSFALALFYCAGCVPLAPDTHPRSDSAVDSSLEGGATEGGATEGEATDEQDRTPPTSAPADAAGDGDDDNVACSPCGEQTFRCSETGVPQVCVSSDGCATWINTGECLANQTCCNGACVPVDDSNCYACGRKCTWPTPTCSPTLRGCGCSNACWSQNQICDPISNACVKLADGPTLWVDASGAITDGAAPEGSGAHPFKTITEALEAAKRIDVDSGTRGAEIVTIHVAQGTYDKDHGEAFPIVLQGGIRLVGDGPDKTFIVGSGQFGAAVTLVIGDANTVNTLSGFTLKPAASKVNPTAISCDRGNATPAGAVPNTHITNLVLDPGYDTGIVATAEGATDGGGCNLHLTSSTVQGRYGVWAVGCHDLPLRASPVAVRLGDDDSSSGNFFQTSGTSVFIQDCVPSVVALHNRFSGGGTGIDIEQLLRTPAVENHHTINYNKFENQTYSGLSLLGGLAVVDDLDDNVFSNISNPPLGGFIGAGVHLVGIFATDGLARIKSARRNTFFRNDIGVWIEIGLPNSSIPNAVDFGTSGDPGNNSFQCNSRPTASTVAGGDVVIDVVPPGGTTVTFPFAGNLWDHTPPIQATLDKRQNGTDLAVRYDATIDGGVSTLFDLSSSGKVTSADCSGRAP